LFFLAEEEFFLLLLVVFDARRLDDDDDDDDVNREDAVSADIVIVAKTYSIAPPWIYVSDVSSEKARFENSPLLGSRPRAADSAGESKSHKKKTMMWGGAISRFFFLRNHRCSGCSRFSCALLLLAKELHRFSTFSSPLQTSFNTN